MKEKQTIPDKLIVIDIKLTRGLVATLSCIVVLGALLTFLALTGGSASASEIEASRAPSTGMRQFYLTLLAFDGDDVLTACEAGYHMASLWEIADPSNLKYNTVLGSTKPDSGQGPPSDRHGWVRTGYESSEYSTIVGIANCEAWTRDSHDYFGTVLSLPSAWTISEEDMGVWAALGGYCDFNYRVWCVED
jgi:hypothetical protein